MQLNALEQRKRVENTLGAISEWHSRAYDVLERTCDIRTTPDDPSSQTVLPALGFYMDHSTLILNGQALRDIIAIDETATSSELRSVNLTAVRIASRILDRVLKDDSLLKTRLGFHNNQLIIICHAVTEIIHVSYAFLTT